MISSHEREERPTREELGRFLLESGVMTSDWAPSFAAIPRSLFLPDLMWPFDQESGGSIAVSKAKDPEAWHGYADANVPIVTQWDDGEHSGTEPGTVSTSSASMPSVVFSMLRDLAVAGGMRVLEIGTGTGWNAGLLAHQLGDRNVVTVEVDPKVAMAARKALHGAGLNPLIVEADGLLGYAPDGLYDRVIATCGLRSIPYAWVEQTRPGGIIVAPWGTQYSSQDAVARLIVAADGESAAGRFTGPVQFMKARSQRLPWPRHADYVPESWPGDARRSSTSVSADSLFEGPFGVAEFIIGLLVRDCVHAAHDQGDGIRTAWFYSLTDTSWAAVRFRADADTEVYQAGPRELWSEVEAAYIWWDTVGRPGLDRFGLTVTAEGETSWLERPDHLVPVAG
ncbi:methyltransferase domain-containing protein [Streptomyces sp. 8N706]|uniref:methyltransferase domain-containing protein n=1 Tax=Streptomyces sp. 8N706 TaxID=3457416 RepID=UPI003FD2DE28